VSDISTGYQPTSAPTVRRADIDLRRKINDLTRRITILEAGGGGGGGGSYRHVQATPASTWVITHNLNSYPNVTVEDSGGSTIEGEIVWNDANQVTLTFSAAFAGVAYLS